jgi:DNA-binding transcriptional LysR family regulator
VAINGRPLDLDLKSLRSFVAVAEALSFSRAAEQVHLSQPALTAQIRSLEARLQITLFLRTTRRVELTEDGLRLLPEARRALSAGRSLERLAAELRGEQGRLQIAAAFYTIDIPERVKLLETLIGAEPEFAFTVLPLWQQEILPRLASGQVELAILLGVPVPPSAPRLNQDPRRETVFSDEFPRIVLRREPVSMLVPRESKLAEESVVRAGALQGLRVAMLGDFHGEPLIGPIARVLTAGGATLTEPPEAHAIGVERYGRQLRIPAVSLGWFGGGATSDDMVRLPIAGLQIATELALVRTIGALSRQAASLWRHAESMFPHD